MAEEHTDKPISNVVFKIKRSRLVFETKAKQCQNRLLRKGKMIKRKNGAVTRG